MEGANFNGSVDMSGNQASARVSGPSADVGLSDRSVEKILGK
jgi:hypothetical protein